MIKNDRVYGVPLVQYKDTKTNIEALSGIGEGAIAYATDTDEFGSYDGTTWTWGQGGSFDLAAAIHAATEETSLTNDDEFGIWESVSGLLRKVKWSTIVSGLGAFFVSQSSSTAANDFLVGSGTGSWIKKTLAEAITILRTALDSVYAAISHTHAAGDVTSGTMATARLGSGTANSATYLRGDQTYNQPKQSLVFGGHGNGGTVPASTTYYICPTLSGLDTVGRAYPIPKSGTIKNLYFRLASSQPASGSLVIEIYGGAVGTTATGVKITIAAGSASGTYSDLSNTFSHTAGDLVNVRITNNATGASGVIGGVAFEVEAGVT